MTKNIIIEAYKEFVKNVDKRYLKLNMKIKNLEQIKNMFQLD